MARCDCFDTAISKTFYTYGKFVYRYKLFFLLLPLLMMFLSLSGLHRFEVNEDIHKLFTPAESKSYGDFEVLKEHFLTGSEGTEFLPNRELNILITRGIVIITAPQQRNLMTNEVMREILDLDEHLRSFVVNENTETREVPALNEANVTAGTYSTFCMKWQGKCIDNAWLQHIAGGMKEHNILMNLTYPFSTFGHQTLNLGPVFSRVETHRGTDIIKEAKVIRLTYSLSGSRQEEIIANWEDMFEEHVDEFQKRCDYIRLSRGTSQSLSRETKEAGLHVMPRFVATFFLLVIFSVIACLTRDWVLSKPWLGFLGVVSACLAIVTTVGLMSFVTQFNVLVALMPFVVLGVGIDNMFILISAWRHLSPLLTVEERMGRTLSGAAVSVTITNLTDVLAFMVGSTTRLPSVQVFCAYAGVAMVFVYIYQMTFFAACMTYLGEREANNLHCYTCRKVLPREEAPNKVYDLFCSGGISKNTSNPSPPENLLTKFFGVLYGPFIVKPVVKIIVVIGYLAYIAGAVYGCTRVTTGMELKNCARDDTPVWRYFNEEDLYFTYYGPSVSVVFEGPIDYWENDTQKRLLETQERFMVNDYIFDDDRLTWSWLSEFLVYLQMSGTASVNASRFYQKLGEFLENPRFKQYVLDLDLDKDDNDTIMSIEASRFIVTSRDMSSTTRQSEMMLKMREFAEESEFSIIVYNPQFTVYEQYIGVLPTTFRTLSIAIACMFIVAIVMIPHPICVVFVTLCVLSIDTAVVGYMSLWGIPLNPISLTNIILCIGFSVDFAAHITYGYLIAPVEDQNLRAVFALRHLGTPILQGALSTIIAISVLSTASVYLFRTFFNTLFLVMVFGAAHGLVFLPVCFSFLGKWMPHRTDDRGNRVLSYSRVMTASPETDKSCKHSPPGSIKQRFDDQFCVEERVSTM